MSVTQGQAATRIFYALVPSTTLIALKAQTKRADTTITCVEGILVKSETELKEAKIEAVRISKDLNKCLKENISFQQEIIHLNNLLTTTHEDYAHNSKELPMLSSNPAIASKNLEPRTPS